MLSEMNNKELDRLAAEFRYLLVKLICEVKWGHLGGTLSLTEIIITLYYRIMRLDPQNPKWPDRDRLVLSKGHAGPMVYIALAYKGFFPKRDLLKLNTEAGFIDVNEPDPEFIHTEPLPPEGGVFGVPAEEMAKIWDDLDTIAIF